MSRNLLLAGSLLLLSLTIPLCAQPLFTVAPGSPLTGASPHSVAVGDFNGDGKPDLATANADSNNVTVLLRNGTGGFTAVAGSPFTVGTKPQSVVVGDFNGDGKPDLAIANAGSDDVTVLLGDGAGGFTPAAGSPLKVGTAPASVVAADFNGDRKLDLATANAGSNSVMVLLGNGVGGFAAAGSPFTVGPKPQSMAMGDLNGDGKLDLFIANAGSNTVTVLQGNGTGGFTATTGSPVAVGANPGFVAVRDFNGDGKLDLATANTGDSTVTVLLGNGTGGFAAAAGSPLAVESNPGSVAVGEFNGDGKLDLATANAADHSVTVLVGDGTGGFAAAIGSPFSVGLTPASVAVGDFNGDGKLDIAAAVSGDASVTVLLNTTPAYWPTFREVTGNPFHLGRVNNPLFTAVGDFNNDGRPDLAIACSATDNVSLMLGNDTGGFTAAPGSPFWVGEGPHPWRWGTSTATASWILQPRIRSPMV